MAIETGKKNGEQSLSIDVTFKEKPTLEEERKIRKILFEYDFALWMVDTSFQLHLLLKKGPFMENKWAFKRHVCADYECMNGKLWGHCTDWFFVDSSCHGDSRSRRELWPPQKWHSKVTLFCAGLETWHAHGSSLDLAPPICIINEDFGKLSKRIRRTIITFSSACITGEKCIEK